MTNLSTEIYPLACILRQNLVSYRHYFNLNNTKLILMKKLMILGFILAAAWACTQQKEMVKSKATAPVVVMDSTEYEITIIDPDFDRWYMIRYSPAMDRSNDYYRSMNGLGVINWNDYFTRNRYNQAIGSYINYTSSVDYGIEVNRRLYWYFKFIEETYRIRLLR